MNPRRQPALALLGALAVTALTGAPALAQPGGGDEQPVTLTLQVADTRDRQAAAAAEEFVGLVSEISAGSVAVEPAFGVPSPGVAVMEGTADLAMLPTRDWDALGVATMNALETPFLIDSDALADEIARGSIATQAMSGLDAVGVTGLAMWPEDLRHLFAFEPSGTVFLTPDDVVGSTILVVAGPPGHDLVTTLGAMVWQEGVRVGAFTGDRHSDAVSGALTGMATGLWGAGLPIGDKTVVAGDIALFAKFQMLVANAEALARLSPAQRDALADAATATRDSAIERRATEVDLGARYCDSGGRIVHAGVEALEAFRGAVKPVVAGSRSDPTSGALITAIEALKATTPATPPAAPCEGDTAIEPGVEPTDTGDHLGTVPPPGTYRADITEEDLLARGASADFAIRNSATVTWEFRADGTYVFEGVDGRCPGTVHSPDGSFFALEEDPGYPCGVGGAFRWRPEPEGISWTFPFTEGLTARDVTDIRAFFERTWTRIDGEGEDTAVGEPVVSELPEPGTWRREASVEEMSAFVDVDTARSLAGPQTLTFDGERWSFATCGGPYTLVDGYLRLTYELDPLDCGSAPLDLLWRTSGPASARSMTRVPGTGEIDQAIFTGTWTRVGGPDDDAAATVTVETSLPPPGVYRMELTLDEALAAGATMAWAIHDLAGTNTLEFHGGQGIWRFRPSEAESRGPRDDGFTTRVEGKHVVLDGSKTGYRTIDTITWRLDGDQLTIELLAVTPQSDFEFDRILLETKPWTRIGDVGD